MSATPTNLSADDLAKLAVLLVTDWFCAGVILDLPSGSHHMIDLVFQVLERDSATPVLSPRFRIELASAERLRQALEHGIKNSQANPQSGAQH